MNLTKTCTRCGGQLPDESASGKAALMCSCGMLPPTAVPTKVEKYCDECGFVSSYGRENYHSFECSKNHTKPEQNSSWELQDFQECRECAKKSGSPYLCTPCLNNRTVIGALKLLLAQAKADSYKEGVKEGRVLAVKYLKDAMEREFEETGGEIGQLELEDLFEAAIAPEVSRDEQ